MRQATIWNFVRLTNLEPNTDYYYRCVSDTAVSIIETFHSQPLNSEDVDIRFAVIGDTRTYIAQHTEVINAMRTKVIELYGDSVYHQINVILNVGDIVGNGLSLPQYVAEFFNPINSVSPQVPFMVSIGNHEAEASYYYDYMKYEIIGGSEGELYYSFRISSVLFIALNSNTQGATQINWLEELLNDSDNNDEIDWIIVFVHHPGHSEIWPNGNTAWTQDEVIPLLSQFEKVELFFYGHSHNYERGASLESNLRIILQGGGGCALARWGMYDNQTDYPEIHRAHDYYGYTLVEIDNTNKSYMARSYSLGHEDMPMNNVLFDSFGRDRNSEPPETPYALEPARQAIEPVTLMGSAYDVGTEPIMSSHFQLTEVQNDWSSPIVESVRDWENIYGDSGPPFYEPIDLNEGIDLTQLSVENGILQLDQTYWWRIRYRNQNLLWSEWSQIQEFELVDSISILAYLPGDVNMANGLWPPTIIGSDVIYLVNYFRGSSSSMPCFLGGFWASADANGDCNIIGSDVTRLVNYFKGINTIEYCTDYEPAWLTPDELPAEAPDGWPNCEQRFKISNKE